ncbi:MAG: hypothetical protein ACLTSG_03620 [Lachnospiraceae bacterium]
MKRKFNAVLALALAVCLCLGAVPAAAASEAAFHGRGGHLRPARRDRRAEARATPLWP